MAKFTDVEQVERTLNELMERGQPLVARLPRQPGKREVRYAHCIGDEALPAEEGTAAAGSERSDLGDHDRIDALERTVADLQDQLAVLQELVERLVDSGPKGG